MSAQQVILPTAEMNLQVQVRKRRSHFGKSKPMLQSSIQACRYDDIAPNSSIPVVPLPIPSAEIRDLIYREKVPIPLPPPISQVESEIPASPCEVPIRRWKLAPTDPHNMCTGKLHF